MWNSRNAQDEISARLQAREYRPIEKHDDEIVRHKMIKIKKLTTKKGI